MKVVYVAQMSEDHNRDVLWLDGFERSNQLSVTGFSTYLYENKLTGILGKIQNRLHIGCVMRGMRSDLLTYIQSKRPDWVHFRLPIHFDMETVNAIKKSGAIVTSYYNDDPFSKKKVFGLHSMFIRAIPFYDAHFVFREKNIEEFLSAGAKRVYYCPPFYDPHVHRYSENESDNYDVYDAVFVGHWEDDGRIKYVEALVAANYNVKIAGPLWDTAASGTPLQSIGPFSPVFGAEYSRLYAKAKAGICFFSKINSDYWTRRPLEIVASGGLLVCERTNEALKHFKDGEEAFFFSSIHELLTVMKFIADHPERASKIRYAGQKRLLEKQDSIDDRIQMMISVVRELC